MYRHDAHCIPPALSCLGLAVVRIVFFQELDVTHKVIESPIAGSLELPGLRDQHIQIGLPHLAAGKRRRIA